MISGVDEGYMIRVYNVGVRDIDVLVFFNESGTSGMTVRARGRDIGEKML